MKHSKLLVWDSCLNMADMYMTPVFYYTKFAGYNLTMDRARGTIRSSGGESRVIMIKWSVMHNKHGRPYLL